jgi:hypothetical protein
VEFLDKTEQADKMVEPTQIPNPAFPVVLMKSRLVDKGAIIFFVKLLKLEEVSFFHEALLFSC